ncbi:MAG: hypothetical protein ACYTDU_15660, partial [Planctomycetota bacterium]
MAIRLYHLATELRMSGSDLWTLLRQRGLDLPSIMTILDAAAAQKARAVASGEVKIKRPEPGKAAEISLPPPVVPAPARSVRPAAAPPRPGKRTPAAAQRLPQSPRRGIKIFRAKETRER